MTPRQREDMLIELCRPATAVDAAAGRVARHAASGAIVVATCLLAYVVYVAAGLAPPRAQAATRVAALMAPVDVVRDDRDVPHVRAATLRDLFAAQGFVEASDRLFQMELTRRYAYGTLAEVLGARALPIDEEQRYYDVRDAAQREWRRMNARDREAVLAFSDGVNAAMRKQPLPVEFRLLLFTPQPWRPQDSIAVSLAVSNALADSWRDVLARDAVWRRAGPQHFGDYFPLSDPAYDVTMNGAPARAPSPPSRPAVALAPVHRDARPGSNAWAAGAQRTIDGHALIANDPHLDLTIPGLWYVMDLRAPGFHAAGASIPGAPGILLGHNERVAWGATNGDVASASVFEAGHLDERRWVRERFKVRFAGDAVRAYYRDGDSFAVPDSTGDGLAIVRPASCSVDCSGIASFLALDRASTVREALRVLSRYGGAAENFVLADTGGAVAYHLAGRTVDDPAWGRYVHPARDLGLRYPAIPFDRLPSSANSRDGVVVSANNKMYGAGYPYRLAAAFDPPYRAYRVAQLLHARSRYDAAYFAAMQLDERSPAELELVRALLARASGSDADAATAAALERWNGTYSSDSRTATIVHRVRANLEGSVPSLTWLLERLRDRTADSAVDSDTRGALYGATARDTSWGVEGAVSVDHPLAPLRFGFLNGETLPGQGDEYTIRLQEPGFAQSFRAVWDVGRWDAGGIAIPSGESGEPGSPHYTDLTPAWIAGRLEPLPFGERAILRAAKTHTELLPEQQAGNSR